MKCEFINGGIACGVGIGTPEELELKKMVEEMDKGVILNPRGTRRIDKAIKGLCETVEFDKGAYYLEMAIQEINELLRENKALKNRIRNLKGDSIGKLKTPKGEEYFHCRLKELIDIEEITPRELADRCGITEVSMSAYCKGTRQPKAVHLHNMAISLGVKDAYLLTGED